jgi:hypothetical protein
MSQALLLRFDLFVHCDQFPTVFQDTNHNIHVFGVLLSHFLQLLPIWSIFSGFQDLGTAAVLHVDEVDHHLVHIAKEFLLFV